MAPYRDLATIHEFPKKIWLVMSEQYDHGGELKGRDVENFFYTEEEAEACAQKLTEHGGFKYEGHYWVELLDKEHIWMPAE